MQKTVRVPMYLFTNFFFVRTSQFLHARRYASAGISRHRVSVCLSHAGIVSKRLNVGSRKQRHMIAKGL